MTQVKLLAIAMLGLLLLSTFSLALVSADGLGIGLGADSKTSLNAGSGSSSASADAKTSAGASVKSTSLADIEAELESNADASVQKKERDYRLRDAISDIDSSVDVKARQSAFTSVSTGTGWASSTDTGFFAKIFWVEKSFVESDSSANATANVSETTKARGLLKLNSESMYKLVLVSESDNSMVFNVTNGGNRKVGTLELVAEKELQTFTVWEGTLKFDSGKEYAIDIATIERKAKGEVKEEIELKEFDGKEFKETGLENAIERGEGKKLGLWARLKASLRN